MKIYLIFKNIFISPYKKLLQKLYTLVVRFEALEVKGKLTVNKKSRVSKQTILGCNVNFNGLRIDGAGKVTIGNNFHSGSDCLLITSFHNYDNGTKIPYDETYIHKSI